MEIGDIVKMKDGGPRMTVVRRIINLATCETDLECYWFINDQLQTATFPQSILEPVAL